MFCHKEPKIATAMGISKDPEKRKRQLENLKKSKGFKGSTEKARMAQKKSAEARAANRTAAEYVTAYFEGVMTDSNGKPLKSVVFKGENMKRKEVLLNEKIKLAKAGNLEAIKYLEKQMGEAPSDDVNVNLSGGMSVQQDYNFFNIDDFADEGE